MENEVPGHVRLKFGYSYLIRDWMQHYNKEETAEADYDL